MNKFTKTLVVASVVTAPALFMFTPASAQATTDATAIQARWGAGAAHAGDSNGTGTRMGHNVAEDAAAFLNISVEEVEAAKDAGTHISDLVVDAGRTLEEWQAFRQEKMDERIDQAVQDGKITAEQAELMKQHAAERMTRMQQHMQNAQ